MSVVEGKGQNDWPPNCHCRQMSMTKSFVVVNFPSDKNVRSHLEVDSSGRIEHEKLFEQVFTVGRHVERDPVLAPQDAFSEFPQRRAVERERTADQRVQDHSQRPDVHLRSVVLLALRVNRMVKIRECWLKWKAWYNWPPSTRQFRWTVFILKIFLFFLQNKLSYEGGQLYWAFPFSKTSLAPTLFLHKRLKFRANNNHFKWDLNNDWQKMSGMDLAVA